MTNNKYRSFRLLYATLAILAFAQGCTKKAPDSTGSSGPPATTAPTPGAPVTSSPQSSQNTADTVLVNVSQAIRKDRLTPLPDQCLAYSFEPKPPEGNYIVDVRENHQGSGCNGDPQTQPLLFSVKVEIKSGIMYTDAGSPGTFHVLVKPQG